MPCSIDGNSSGTFFYEKLAQHKTDYTEVATNYCGCNAWFVTSQDPDVYYKTATGNSPITNRTLMCACCGALKVLPSVKAYKQQLNTAPRATPPSSVKYPIADWSELITIKDTTCECGAHKVGAANKSPIHSHWCPEYLANRIVKQTEEEKCKAAKRP